MMNEITQKHVDKNYFLKIERIKNIVTVVVPENKLLNLPQLVLEYKVTKNGLVVGKTKYKMPDYAIPLVINTDISLKIKDRPIDTSLYVVYNNGVMVKTLKQALPPMSNESSTKCQLLASYYGEIIYRTMQESDAEKLGIKEGFSAILLVISSGGM